MPPDEAAPASAPVTNGVQAPAGEAAPVARAQMTRAQQDAADRASFIAGYPEDEAEPVVEKAAPVKKPAKPVDEPDEAVEAEAEADDEDLEDDLDDDLDEVEEALDDEEEDETPGKADPAVAQAHAKIRKLETRMRESVARDAAKNKAAFESERDAFVADWKPKIEAAQKFERIPKHDIIGILKAKGYTEAEYAEASKIIWGHSPEVAADPKNREAVTRLQREREIRERVEASDARTAALEAKLAKQESDAVQSKKVEAYLGKVAKAANDNAPHTKEMLELHPKATRARLDRLAYKMSLKSGDLVDPKKVVRAFEKLEQARKAMYAPAGVAKSAPSAASKSKPQAIKVVDKSTPVVDTIKSGILPSRSDMIERLGKINRGELDPDAD